LIMSASSRGIDHLDRAHVYAPVAVCEVIAFRSDSM